MTRKKNFKQIRTCLILIISLLFFSCAYAQDESMLPGPGEVQVDISAGSVSFSGDNQQVVFSDGVTIKYEDISISAPTITAFYSSQDTVDYFLAESSESTPVYLYKEKETFTSKKLKAYVQKKAYFLYELRGTYKAKDAKGKEKEIILAAEKSRSKGFDEVNVTEAQKGYLTTCEEKRPHYRFEANYIVVKESNEIIAYDLLMYIYDIPILPYPVYFSSLERKAQPVESSFTFSGASGIQTHLRFNYYSKGDEIGSVFFDTVGDGKAKGNTIGAENKFTLPDRKTRVYFYSLQKTAEDFANRTNQVKFELAKKWDEGLETLFFFNNKMSIKQEEITNRNTDFGISVKGTVNKAPFVFGLSKSELRSNAKNTDSLVLPSFSMGAMGLKLFPEAFPIGITFKKLAFNTSNVSDASVPFLEQLKSIKYSGQYGISTSVPEVIIRDIKLVNGFNTNLDYSFTKAPEYKDDIKLDNTFTLPKIGFDWEDFFGIHTQYTVRAGFLKDKEDKEAYRYAENVVSDMTFNFFFWKNTLSHDFVFLNSDGNTSRFDFNKEKNLLNYTSSVDLAFIGSKITVKTSYDFLKEDQKLSNPLLLTNTNFNLLGTNFKLDSKNIIDAEKFNFLSTDYAFSLANNFFNNKLNFVYLYEQEPNIKKLTDSFGFSFGPINAFKKFSSDFELIFNHYDENDRLELDRITSKNEISFGQIGVIDNLVDKFDIQILPKEKENDQKINYIKNGLSFKIDKTTIGLDTKYSRNKKLDFDFSGAFEKLKLQFGTRYDLESKKVETAKIAIVKDLHCWQNETSAEFGLKQEAGESKLVLQKFSTSFAIKQFPEKFIKVEPLKKEFDLAIF